MEICDNYIFLYVCIVISMVCSHACPCLKLYLETSIALHCVIHTPTKILLSLIINLQKSIYNFKFLT